jgi:hypothetical protein
MEIVYFVGAFSLDGADLWNALQYRCRNRAAVERGGEIARERYEKNET